MRTVARERSTPELVIDGRPSSKLHRSLMRLWLFRDTIGAFAERDIRVKYKQTALGVAWAVIQPLAFMAIFTLTLGHLADVLRGPYLTRRSPCRRSCRGHSCPRRSRSARTRSSRMRPMVRRVYFPREVPVLGSAALGTVDFVIGLVLFMLIGPFLGAHVTGWWLLTPVLLSSLAFVASASRCRSRR